MDAHEATIIVFSRIQNLDPEHASKIMGLLLIQDYGEKEMIRLAFGPESLVHSVIVEARAELGLSSNASSQRLTPSSPFVFGAGRSALSRQKSSSPAGGVNLPASSPYPAQWEPSLFSDFQNLVDLSKGSSELSLMDDFRYRDQLSLLSDYGSPASGTRRTGEILAAASFPPYGGGNAGSWRGSGLANRRSCSVTDVCFGGSDDLTAGLGWKPCLYYSRGYCKNGTTCRFMHGGLQDAGMSSDFRTKLEWMEQYPELLRAAATAAVMGEFGRSHLEFKPAMVNSSSRQIYLTFPADSTFREEDVSKYFSIYGPVQDVRIPYQQKRMFGFVSFVYAETVRVILAIGNPHYVCDARVLVKPYKEKGKVPDKYRKQQPVERLEFSACGSPTSLDSRNPRDLQLGGRTVYNSQEMLWRRKMGEEAEQQAIELQCRRLMSMQLLDIRKPYQHPTISPFSNAQSRNSPKSGQENCCRPVVSCESPNMAAVSAEKESSGKDEDTSEFLVESFKHNLPDNLFASPEKSAGEYGSLFSHSATGEAESLASPNSPLAHNDPIASSLLLASSTLGMASIKSCRFPIPPRISSSQETIGV